MTRRRMQTIAQVIVIITLGFFLGVSTQFARSQQGYDTVMTRTDFTNHDGLLATDNAARQATHWGLTLAQWQRYQSLLALGVEAEYAALTPVEVLGLYAQTAEQLHALAKLVAKQKEARIARELRFGHAVYEAESVLFADQQPIGSDPVTLLPGRH